MFCVFLMLHSSPLNVPFQNFSPSSSSLRTMSRYSPHFHPFLLAIFWFHYKQQAQPSWGFHHMTTRATSKRVYMPVPMYWNTLIRRESCALLYVFFAAVPITREQVAYLQIMPRYSCSWYLKCKHTSSPLSYPGPSWLRQGGAHEAPSGVAHEGNFFKCAILTPWASSWVMSISSGTPFESFQSLLSEMDE